MKKPGVAEANRKRWANVDPALRSKRMAKIAKKRMQDLSPAQRKKIGRSLTKQRLAKQK